MGKLLQKYRDSKLAVKLDGLLKNTGLVFNPDHANYGLHTVHWVILGLSMAVTVAGYMITSQQVIDKSRLRFERETDHVAELVQERMELYENVLRAGVAYINTNGTTRRKQWRVFADSIKIEKRYPGINGIGVIFRILPAQMPAYLTRERKQLAGYKIYPEHKEAEYWPITYIEPVETNRQAVGLDMAHEANRYSAARASCQSGDAKITGPITLVQDEGRTAGFLFYSPFYKDRAGEPSVKNCGGLVYAPFVVRKLMQGVLSRERRNILLSISDGESVIYNEYTKDDSEVDPEPMFTRRLSLKTYGRTWNFKIESSQRFRNLTDHSQPWMILGGGTIIDILLAGIFLMLGRSARQAVRYADQVTRDLQEKQEMLTRLNDELTQYNFSLSHDLVSPLKTTRGYLAAIKEDIVEKSFDTVLPMVETCEGQVMRLEIMIKEVLAAAREVNTEEVMSEVDIQSVVGNIIELNRSTLDQKHIRVIIDLNHEKPFVSGRFKVRQILENLITNAIKYSDADQHDCFIELSTHTEADRLVFVLRDNGIGIPPEEAGKIFSMFYQARKIDSGGTGLGLYITHRHVQSLKGAILLDQTEPDTVFRVELPYVRPEAS